MAKSVWNMLEVSGSIDWAGLPLIVGLLGITDIDGLISRLVVIKAYVRKEK